MQKLYKMTVYQENTLKNDYSLKIRVRQMLACLTIDYAPAGRCIQNSPTLGLIVKNIVPVSNSEFLLAYNFYSFHSFDVIYIQSI
jgi:hypothetical protein